jgi:hypothetical protein
VPLSPDGIVVVNVDVAACTATPLPAGARDCPHRPCAVADQVDA